MKIVRIILQVLLPLVVLAVAANLALTMIEAREEPATQPVEVTPPLVRVMEVKPTGRRLTVKAEGTVFPRTQTDLVPEVSGRVVWVSPSLASGGFFEKDEELLKVDRREYELAVIRARSAVAQAELTLATEQEEADLARKEWESLGKGKPTPLTFREPQVAQAKASLASAQAALDQTEYDLERTVVTAPYTGLIRTKSVDVGQFVSRGTTVASVYAVDFAEVRLPIPDAELEYVDLPLAFRDQQDQTQGPKVTLRTEFAGREHTWQGRIVRTEAEIDPQSRMVLAVARVADPYGQGGRRGRPPLAVGMFVEAEIEGKWAGSVTVLPRSALRGKDTVYVVDENGRLEFRPVQILRTEREQALISSGLKAGDRVCLSILETAVDGMKVQVVETEAAPVPVS
ncbi:MAG: efflux RND transporter periplasmic adaptor subunit [Acidobacteria bacterium]|nr:efflux RND transporter periplasmic adaptor subunit [Acidobacteriota bacterium]